MGATQKVDFTITAQDMFTAVMNGVIAGMTTAKKSMEQFGPTAQKAADQFSQAFKTLNIRSAFDIKAEQTRLIDAFNQIKNSGKASAEEVARAQTAMQSKLKDLQAELTNTATASEKSGASLGAVFKVAGLGAFYFNNIKTAVESAWQALMGFSGPAMEMTRINAMFKATSGSSELAAKDLAYVRAESNRLGLSFQDSALSFAKFSAASRNTALEGQKTKDVFSGIAEAVTALQLPADAADRIMVQLEQMMSKNKVSAQDLRVVAESLPGTYEAVAEGLGMTTAEMAKQMEAGNLLATDVLPKLAKHLHDLYGTAALDAANSPAAQLNRLKTATFELMAVLGQKPMQLVGDLAGALSGLANSAKAALDWMAHNAWGQSLSNLAAGLGFAATALTVAAGAQAIYTAATWAATTATGAFTVSLLANPLVLAFGAAVIGVVAALSALADAFDGSTAASTRSGAATKQTTEEMRKAAAERKQIEDNYEKAVGISLERQIAKRKAQLDQDLKAIEAKYSEELKTVAAGSDAEKQLVERLSGDKIKVENAYFADVDKMRKENLKKQEDDAATELKNRIEHLKRLGQTREADSFDIAAKNRADLKAVDEYYKGVEDSARASGKVVVGLEQERAAAIDQLRKKQALDAAQRGYEQGQKELQAYRGIMDSKAALMLAAAGTNIEAQRQAQVMIEAIEIDFNRRRYQAAAAHFQNVAALYPKDTDQYRSALNDMTAAHKSYLENSTAAYRKYADEIKRLDQGIADFRLSIDQKIADIRQRGMTDTQKYADNQKRFDEAVSKSREALAAKDSENAKKYAQQAEELASRLADKRVAEDDKLVEIEKRRQQRLAEIARQSTGAQTDQQRQASEMAQANAEADRERLKVLQEQKTTVDGITNAEKSLNQVKELRTDIYTMEKQNLQQIQDFKLDPKSLPVSLDEGALSAVKSVIAELTKSETKTIYIKTVGSTGGDGSTAMSDSDLAASIATYRPGFFEGGKVANGSPLRDSVNAMLAKGEWVINNGASRFWGDDVLAAVNAPFSAAGRGLQQMLSFKLPTPAAAAAGDVPKMGSLDLNVAGLGTFPVQAPRDILSDLGTAMRRLKRSRPQ